MALSHWTRAQKWLLGSVVGVILLGVLGNQLSNIVPNPFQYILRSLRVSPPDTHGWYAARIQNRLERELSYMIRSYKDTIWQGDTLRSGEIKAFSDTGPLYVVLQGDFFALLGSQKELRHLTHTYGGMEAYELVVARFPIEPISKQLDKAPLSHVDKVLGGSKPKVLTFADSPDIPFSVVGPNGLKLPTVIPAIVNDEPVYPFQNGK